MGIKARIQFDNPSSTYRAGELMKGVVFLNSSELKEITVTFHGEGNVIKREVKLGHFAQKAYNSSSNRIHPTSANPYFQKQKAAPVGETQTEVQIDPETGEVRRLVIEYRNQEIYLHSSISLPVKIDESSPEQKIPFSFQLPENLPSSCDLKAGSIKYFAEALVHVEKSFLKISYDSSDSVKEPFNVLGNLDLAKVNGALSPVMIEDGEQFYGFGCCCAEGDEFWLKLNLAKSGFVPGENISFLVSYKNESTITLKKITTSLIQTVTFSAVGKELSEEKKISEVSHSLKMHPGAKGACVGQLPVHSSTYITDFGGCRIMKCRYVFRATARGSVGKKVTVEIPVTIGDSVTAKENAGKETKEPAKIVHCNL